MASFKDHAIAIVFVHLIESQQTGWSLVLLHKYALCFHYSGRVLLPFSTFGQLKPQFQVTCFPKPWRCIKENNVIIIYNEGTCCASTKFDLLSFWNTFYYRIQPLACKNIKSRRIILSQTVASWIKACYPWLNYIYHDFTRSFLEMPFTFKTETPKQNTMLPQSQPRLP